MCAAKGPSGCAQHDGTRKPNFPMMRSGFCWEPDRPDPDRVAKMRVHMLSKGLIVNKSYNVNQSKSR